MKFRPTPFNRFLLFLALLATGCQTDSLPKPAEASTLRLFLEARPNAAARTQPIMVFLDAPLRITVENEPFLNESSVEAAKVIEAGGKYGVEIAFTTHGKLILETTTLANRGRHIAVFSNYPDGRWIGAPLINQRLGDGVLLFRMDGSRDDAERFVSGLNKVATALKKRGDQY